MISRTHGPILYSTKRFIFIRKYNVQIRSTSSDSMVDSNNRDSIKWCALYSHQRCRFSKLHRADALHTRASGEFVWRPDSNFTNGELDWGHRDLHFETDPVTSTLLKFKMAACVGPEQRLQFQGIIIWYGQTKKWK